MKPGDAQPLAGHGAVVVGGPRIGIADVEGRHHFCQSVDETPWVDGAPAQEAVEHDTRSSAQRNHDGLNAALRALPASGELGQHNGVPAAIIVTTTLKDLEAAAGRGLTGGGTLVPMSDVIRLAWLCITPRGWPRPANASCSTPVEGVPSQSAREVQRAVVTVDGIKV